MTRFVLYLIESGMCITLLYLVYVLFFRKETYFNFNRLYLVSIMVLSLLIPVVHVTIAVNKKDDIETTFQDIGKFRSYYTNFIAFTEEDFGKERYRSYEKAEFEEAYHNSVSEKKGFLAIHSNKRTSRNIASYNFNKLALFKIIIAIYFSGVLFFLIRLVVLLFWLAKTVKSNVKHDRKDYKLVLLEKDIPPFSFFKYIFVNKDAPMLSEFEQVLAHEKVHVGQKHSLDLILAHAISVFQWFNPLVWNMQKAVKTTHEYIADSKVVNQGFELFDYQSLLLSQLVSIQSVELVNNFNLISIKKRINMMTKNKSRFTAKLKALLIIPFAIAVFFLFADMTVKSPTLNFNNFSSVKTSNLDGMWENKSNSFVKLLLFKGNQLSILESIDEIDVIDLNISIKDDVFEFNRFGKGLQSVKYELSGNELKVWWSNNEYSIYSKTDFENSSQLYTPDKAGKINLPTINNAKIIDKPDLIIDIYVLPDKYIVENEECTLSDLKEVLSEKFYSINKLDIPFATARLVVDKNTKMKSVNALKQVMRELFFLRVSFASYPKNNTSKLQYHAAGLTKMLPPLDALVLERDEIEDRIIDIVDGDDLNYKAKELRAFVLNNPDYIIVYQNSDNALYGNYIAANDMVYDVVYGLRNEYSKENYNLDYSELSENIQKEVRKKYPVRLSEVPAEE